NVSCAEGIAGDGLHIAAQRIDHPARPCRPQAIKHIWLIEGDDIGRDVPLTGHINCRGSVCLAWRVRRWSSGRRLGSAAVWQGGRKIRGQRLACWRSLVGILTACPQTGCLSNGGPCWDDPVTIGRVRRLGTRKDRERN